MLYLALSVCCSVLLGFIFKLFPRYRVDSFQAIVFNYFTCLACGTLHLGHFPVGSGDIGAPWLPFALALGFIFISGFNGAALTVRHFGVTISQIMQKMSILMTVPFAILVYGESSGAGKVTGFVLALVSIILVNWSQLQPGSDTSTANRKLFWVPVVTWFLSGLLEVLFVVVNHRKLTDPNDPTFISTIFGTAGLIGLAIAAAGWISGRLTFSWNNVAGGIVLGIPNYGSMLFLLMALGHGLEGSFVFPAVNVSIILVTTIGAVALFRERLSAVNWSGIALALAAILLISFS